MKPLLQNYPDTNTTLCRASEAAAAPLTGILRLPKSPHSAGLCHTTLTVPRINRLLGTPLKQGLHISECEFRLLRLCLTREASGS